MQFTRTNALAAFWGLAEATVFSFTHRNINNDGPHELDEVDHGFL